MSRLRSLLASPHRPALELGGVIVLYALYQAVRGLPDGTLAEARRNASRVVDLERGVHLFWERGIQDWAHGVPGLMTVLGLAYVTLHLAVTGTVLVWLYRQHRDRFPLVRTSLVLGSALALVGFFLFPAAPPRLAGVGIADSVQEAANVNLGSGALSAFYNPLAAVPSLHFAFALLVGVVVSGTARRRLVRTLGALYPPFVLLTIVATGNHFLFDAAAGAAVMGIGWLAARAIVGEPAPRATTRLAAASC